MTGGAPQVTRALVDGYFRHFPHEVARSLAYVPEDEVLQLLSLEPPGPAAAAFARMDLDIAARLIAAMDPALLVPLLGEVDPTHAATLLARLDEEVRSRCLAALPRALTAELTDLMAHRPDSAGSLMDPRFITFRPEETVALALARIREQRQRRVMDLCLIDDQRYLLGVVSLQDVAVAQPDQQLSSLVRSAPVSIQATAPREEVVGLLEGSKLASLPVTDFQGRLLGIIRHDALVSAAQQDATVDMQAMVGAGRDERALSRATFAVRKRLPWLQINLATAFLAAAVVGLFENTIARFTALAVLLPVVAGQSGNTGSQALAVTMRGLALREIRLANWLQVALKEIAAGFMNGCAVGLTTGLVVYLWYGSIGLPLVLTVSMVCSMVMAGLAGALIPVVLTAFRQDPAQSASIILTTVTDVVGFLSFLGLATVLSSAFGLAL
ncbi:MAG: magnesium transporter [Gemmatimonadota bacterium]